MEKIFEILKGALDYLALDEDIQPEEVHEVEIEMYALGRTQGYTVKFPEHHYVAFTYDDWRPGDFVAIRTDECYYCGKKMEEDHDCLAEVA